jgi:protein CpxP
MSAFTYLIAKPAPVARSVAIAALLGATVLASPLNAARADNAALDAAVQHAQVVVAEKNQAAAGATEAKGETVEQRINTLRSSLKITPDQDAKWNDVAQAMRENAVNMDKLVAASRTAPPQNMSAVDDLRSYQKFTQAHVDGLKNLIVSFEKLYAAMPDAQKKNADAVFAISGRGAPASNG